MSLKSLSLPEEYNYIACFLTLDCNMHCDYCIISRPQGKTAKKITIPGEKWINALNRISCSGDLPVTLQGGEPSLHPDFIPIIKNICQDLNIDILTNLSFDTDVFIKEIDPRRLCRGASYANIRVSYHPEHMDRDRLLKNTLKMQSAGFSIGVYGILHPRLKETILSTQKVFQAAGIDFRTKEFLGTYGNKSYGAYRYPGAVGKRERKSCLCRTTELIIGPNADIFRCHHDLYNSLPAIGNLLDARVRIEGNFRECTDFGACNPCDVKIKNNRFQRFGHTSVEIKDIVKQKVNR